MSNQDNNIEIDYNLLVEEINQKLQAATQLINEANQLAKVKANSNLENLNYIISNLNFNNSIKLKYTQENDLILAMNDAGWAVSHQC